MITPGASDPLPTEIPNASSLAAILKSGMRAAVFMRFNVSGTGSSWNKFVAVAVLGLVVQFLADLARVGANGEFLPYGLPEAVFRTGVFLFAAWVAACIARASPRTLSLALVFAAVSVFYMMFAAALEAVRQAQVLPADWQNHWMSQRAGLNLWFSLACGVAAFRFAGLPRWRGVAALLLTGVIMFYALMNVYTRDTLWAAPYNPEDFGWKDTAISEEAFYLQPQLLDDALEAIDPGIKDRIDLYFVGVAGYAQQDVFRKEVDYVAFLFEKKFGTAGRSVKLVNNPDSAANAPIATVTSLGATLKEIGLKMNKDEDLLFLFLTSHGSKEHEFSLEFGGIQFNVLNPRTLRELLDDSGIRNRVIVVSACYSGGFTEALKDEHTVVITAAAPDKTSFGCSNDADFTYFGKAYFQDALAGTDSFITAFDMAKPRIAAREKKEEFEPSDPGIFVGAKIGPVLAEFSRQRAAPARLNAPR
jgi:hypothetical protein